MNYMVLGSHAKCGIVVKSENQLLLRFHFLILSHLSINISWKNGKLHEITALEINFLTSNQLLVNTNQLFETLEKK